MSLEKQLAAHNAGAAGRMPTGTSDEELAAHAAGAATGGGGGSPLAGMGIMLLIPALLLCIPALVIGTCLFPLAGLVTLFSTAIISGLLADNVAFLVVLAVVLVPGIVIFFMMLRLEKVLEQYRWYRTTRHVARAIVVGFVAHVVFFAFNGAGRFAPGTSVLDRISLLHVVAVVAATGAAYIGSRRLDSGIGQVDGFRTRFQTWRRRPA